MSELTWLRNTIEVSKYGNRQGVWFSGLGAGVVLRVRGEMRREMGWNKTWNGGDEDGDGTD